MNIQELKKQLKRAKIPADSYSLMTGGLPNEAYCLTKEAGTWVVYYSEKGHRSGLTVFKSESEACVYLYNKLKRYGKP